MSIRSFDFRFGPTSCRAEVRGDMPSLADVCPDRSGGALVTFSTGATVTLTGVGASQVTTGWFTT